MADLDGVRFPPDISRGATGGPRFDTMATATDSGHVYVNQNWSSELAHYEVSHHARVPADWEPLRSFFRVVKGRFNTFRFKDWSDFAATSTEGKFRQLTSTTFQMVKRYSFGGQTFDRDIFKPISAVSVTGGSGVSVNYATGVVTVSSGTPTAWSGEFDVRCRLGIDQMDQTFVDRAASGQLVLGWVSISIDEDRA